MNREGVVLALELGGESYLIAAEDAKPSLWLASPDNGPFCLWAQQPQRNPELQGVPLKQVQW